MSFCAGILISSEFLPISLLTPIANDLHITEGHAGQTISISGFFALVTSLFISSIIGVSDRKRVVLLFTALMIASGAMVAFAPNAPVMMIGRALLGVAVGGFWSISAAIIMRLVPKDSVPKALAILNGGNAVASTLAAPIGSLLGSLIGWRGAFFCVVPLAAIAFIWLWRCLPGLPAEKESAGPKAAFALLTHRPFALGMIAVSLFFLGQFSLFTYLRPFLEGVTGSSAAMLSGLLLATGTAGFVGTCLVGAFLKNHLYNLLIATPIIMGVIAISLIMIGKTPIIVGVLLIGWGFLGTAAPAAWWTWLSRTMPHEAEAGGGLMVAVVQLAIMLGAIIGGTLFDTFGVASTFGFAAAMLMAAALMTFLAKQSVTTAPVALAA
jgi:predicted MFS family arabinose efflux permease